MKSYIDFHGAMSDKSKVHFQFVLLWKAWQADPKTMRMLHFSYFTEEGALVNILIALYILSLHSTPNY